MCIFVKTLKKYLKRYYESIYNNDIAKEIYNNDSGKCARIQPKSNWCRGFDHVLQSVEEKDRVREQLSKLSTQYNKHANY